MEGGRRIGTARDVPSAQRTMTGERALNGPQQLLERDGELAEIDACIAAAAAEEGSFVVLEGRSGMGKSALLAEVRRRGTAAGFASWSAVASELEGEVAFGVVRQLLEPALGALNREERAQVLDGAAALAEPVFDVGREPEGRSPFAALHGLYWLAANLSARTPVLLAVDDAHWADTGSLRWLAYLLNRLDGLRILIAIATRAPQSGPEGEVLTSILTHPRARILRLTPLGEASVAALVRTALAADPDPNFTAACLRVSTGNPLWLSELLRVLRADGVPPTSTAVVDLGSPSDAIARRVQRDLRSLGDEAERLARALAVIGDGTELRVVARLAGLDLDQAARAVDDLLAVDLVTRQRPPRFVHPLLRAAVYDRLPAGTRQKLHRQAAEILGFEGAGPEAVAAHLLRCDAGDRPETIEWLRAAAPLAQRRGAPQAAVAYLERALAEQSDGGVRATVLAELGRAELAAGAAAAPTHLREALTGTTDPRTRAAILGDLAQALIILQSDERASRDLLDKALDELRGCDPDAFTRLECIVMGLAPVDPSRVVTPEQYPHLRELAQGRTPSAELARTTLAMLLSWRDGNRVEGLTQVGAGFDWSGLVEASPLHSIAVTWSILALLGLDELDRAVSWCKTVIHKTAAKGDVHDVMIGTVYKAYAEFRMGLLADAEADVTTALELSQQHTPYWMPVTAAYLAEILFERGRPQAAYDAIESISVSPGIAGGVMEVHVRGVRGRLRCLRGWRQQGVDDLRAVGALCELQRLRNPIICPWQAWLAAALRQDSIGEARQLATEYLANARRSGIPRAIGIALRSLAQVDRDNAVDLLRAAIAALEGAPAPLDLARALVDLGGALRRQGHRVDAREPLREALEIAARCGAGPLMEQAQAEALSAGARPRRPRLRGVDALTPSELRVARLAAEGRSNREIAQALFITTNTVADHLGSSYSKLEITSRGQLTTALG